MMDQTIALFCICDEALKILGVQEKNPSQIAMSEVMTFAIVAAQFFKGNYLMG